MAHRVRDNLRGPRRRGPDFSVRHRLTTNTFTSPNNSTETKTVTGTVFATGWLTGTPTVTVTATASSIFPSTGTGTHSCVVSVDQRCGAAVGRFGPVMGILVEDGLHAHGRSALLLVGSLGCGVDLANDATVVGLALVFSHVEEAGQGRELDVVGGSELAWIDVFACGAGAATWLPLALRARAA